MAEVQMPRLGAPKSGGPDRFHPKEKPAHGKATAGRLLKLFLNQGKGFFIAMALTVISAILSVLVPSFTGKVFDVFGDTPLVLRLVLAIVALHLSTAVTSVCSGILVLRASQRLVKGIRTDLFAKLQRLPLAFFDQVPRGDTLSRLTNDVDTISLTIAQSLVQLVSSLLTIIGSLIIMIRLDLSLTFCVLFSVPLVILLTRLISRKSHASFLSQQQALGRLNSVVTDSIQGLKMVKTFTGEKAMLEQFEEQNTILKESGTSAQTWSGLMMPLMNVINNLVFALVAIIGGTLCTKGTITIGIVVTFLSYAKHFASPLNQVAGLFTTIQSALAGAERIFDLLDRSEEKSDGKDAIRNFKPEGNVTFSHVSFSYDGIHQVLHDISFTVKAGEHIALVGETGSGKTTIVNLLTRSYEVTEGSITIDGESITSIARENLKTCFSVVPQESCMFSGTIADNIRYSDPSASMEKIKEAAHIAHADTFIEKLPEGYETRINGENSTLSEGERQSLAIARAVLRKAPILILDEATSSVDTKTEKEIQKGMLSLMKGRTTFLIAHRLSTIRDADRILVIDKGRIIQSGSHVDLMGQQGKYRDMVYSQAGISH